MLSASLIQLEYASKQWKSTFSYSSSPDPLWMYFAGHQAITMLDSFALFSPLFLSPKELDQSAQSMESRLKLRPSWVLVLRNALEITGEERPLALEMCLHGYDDCPETRLNNGSFLPQNGPPRGTTAWYTPY